MSEKIEMTSKELFEAQSKAWDLGVNFERQRVIKLLERLWKKSQGTDIPAVVALLEAIELTNGESNA